MLDLLRLPPHILGLPLVRTAPLPTLLAFIKLTLFSPYTFGLLLAYITLIITLLAFLQLPLLLFPHS